VIEIQPYLEDLATCAPSIREIWLLGSRANGTATQDSDWDFLVFGGCYTHAQLKTATQLYRHNVDCLVMIDKDRFKSAWGEKEKSGSLSSWKWQKRSPCCAVYIGTKWQDNGEAAVVSSELSAVRIWPPSWLPASSRPINWT